MPDCWTLGKGDEREKFSYQYTATALDIGTAPYTLVDLDKMLTSLQATYGSNWFKLDANRSQGVSGLTGMGHYFRHILGRSNQDASRVAAVLVDARCLTYDYQGKSVFLKVLRTTVAFAESQGTSSSMTVASSAP